MSKLGEEPVYPAQSEIEDVTINGLYHETYKLNHLGLTKREWFAGMAMQGLINGCGDIINKTSLTSISVELADAMLTALEIPGEEKKTEAAVAIKVKGQSSFLIEADELQKKIMEKLPKRIVGPHSQGIDEGLRLALDEIDRMTGKK